MLIGLKGDNYYSKVFKRVNYKLSNSTFWVVITCTVLDACGASSRVDATLRRWLSPSLDSPVFCTCASTLFVREAIYISFSSTILVSLAMTPIISANCSFTNVVLAAIIGIVIEKEVKELGTIGVVFIIWHFNWQSWVWVSAGVGIGNRVRRLIPKVL